MINSIFAIRKRREFILLAITLVFFWKIFAGQVLACTNECLNDGDKQCGGQITYNNNTYSTFQICSDSNLDGCLEWSGLTACNPGQSCSAGACVAAQQVCVPGALSVCKVCNAAGTAWADDSTKCPSGKVCQNDVCIAAQTCTPGAVSVCKVCNTAGNAWADDSTKCASGKICQNDFCVVSGCAATTCTALSHTCGNWGDGCGGTLNCGTCASGLTCTNGACVTPVSVTPTADLRANGVDGPLSVTAGQSVALSWTSTNASACAAFGSWTGTQPASGLSSVAVPEGSNTYSIICSGSGGSVNDSVVVNGVSSAPVVSVPSKVEVVSGGSYTLQATVQNPSNSALTYSWFCSAGTVSSTAVLAPVYSAPTVSREIDSTCTLTVHDDKNHTVIKSVPIAIQPSGSKVQTPLVTTVPTTTRAQLLAKIAQIQALIASLQQQLAALNAPTVVTTGNGVLSVSMQAGNVTQSLAFSRSVSAHAGDALTFKIIVSNSANGTFADVVLNNALPVGLGAAQNIKINGVAATGSFSQGLDIGGFTAGLGKTITFTASVASSSGSQSLTDTATVAAGDITAHDAIAINVN